MQEVRCDKGGTVRSYFFIEKVKKITIHQRAVSAVKRVEFVSGRMTYIVLRGHRSNIIILNVHTRTEEKTDYSKGTTYEDLEQVFLSAI